MAEQLTLFEDEPRDSTTVLHNYLNVPGLSYLAELLNSEQESLVLAQVDSRPWQTDLKRRVQHYGYKYDYKARRVAPSMFVGELPPFAVSIGRRLADSGLMPAMPDQLIVNEYLPGQGITPHVDCEPCFQDFITTVSLGSVYTMDLIEVETGEIKSIRLELGSCLVFSGPARYQWKHGIKARKTDDGQRRGRRVSLTFRSVIVSDDNSAGSANNG